MNIDLDDYERLALASLVADRMESLLEIAGDTTRTPDQRRSAARKMARLRLILEKLRREDSLAPSLKRAKRANSPGV